MVVAARPLDVYWHAWIEEHPGFSLAGKEQTTSGGLRILPVRFDEGEWDGLLLRRPDGTVTVYWRG